ncbi:NitT/TauT family transport system permease protein [Kitasatospora gansuensis]|uniref:NitT/TauT family transport system permease protein n=1 Tax=Kitasatospora gansuensis TaxID=258050 RepID=A0A7W7SGU7_9ACTN|nr:ABC transporter permease [Kitasatospora gansuensis]MBB4950154.1 NitT/TauT family transport system permease protein [Kitasatospora gansuensis]
MASTDAPVLEKNTAADVGAGLDALDAVVTQRTPLLTVLRQKALPPLVAVALVLGVWQLAFNLELTDEYKLPSPGMVWAALADLWSQGTLFSIVWTSLWRGLSGFVAAVVIGTPIGLLVAQVKPVRAAIGPILSGLQSLPSVAWVPAAVIWLGVNPSTMYAVILLGAVPSVANGLVAGIDQVPPLLLRAGRTMGATGLSRARHVLLPGALPGYLAGLKQGWAFSWRSLMAAELIAASPDLGVGLGRFLENQREFNDMSGVLLGIILILLVGVAIDLLFFSPLERRVLRNRGLLGSNR